MQHKPLYAKMKAMTSAELRELMAKGRAPSPEQLAGWEFRGWNHPPILALLGIRKFVKGFFINEHGKLEGYNRQPRQNAFDEEWTSLGKPFGFFDVEGSVLDYGKNARNPRWKPERFLIDHLVQPDPSEPDVFLGLATLALPGRPATNYFLIERLQRSEWRP